MPHSFKGLALLSSIVVGLALVGNFTGCTTDSSGSGSGGNFSTSFETDVQSITAPSGSAAGTIVTRSVDAYCDAGDLVRDTTTDTSKYIVTGGNLYLWTQGDCLATKLTGTSTTIIGTWKGASLAFTDSVPAAFRPSMCSGDDEEVDTSGFFENFSVEYQVSSSKITGKLSGKVCFAGTFADSYHDSTFSDAGYTVTSEGCTQLKLRNPSNKTATITSDYRNDSATVTFTYGNKVCTGSYSLGLEAPTSCSEDDTDGTSLTAYGTCVAQSGFFGDISAEKRAALGKSMSKAVKSSFRGPF